MSTNWTANDIPTLRGKTAIVTGANSGIGFVAANAFAANGARVVLACRNAKLGVEAAKRIVAAQPDAQAEFMTLDLASLNSVRAFAERVLESNHKIDILVNNAGIMMNPFEKTADGFESQMGINHLGHFALTGLLMPALLKAKAARVVNVSSLAHGWAKLDPDHILYENEREYSARIAYGNSKLANLLFTKALQQRFEAAGSQAIAVSAHPGASNTNLGRHLEKRWYLRVLKPLLLAVTQPAETGALPTLRAATDPNAEGGDFYGPGGFKQYAGYPVKVGCASTAKDITAADKLWRTSERLTRVTFQTM